MAPYIRVGKYIVKKKIGEGAFAEVRLAVHEETKIEYAVKVFNRSLLQRNRFENDVKKEIRIMQHLRHPNIVSIHAVLVTASKMYLVMEYVRGGELYDEIVSNGRIDEERSRHYFQQLVDAMAYCHRRGVVHRDLKPENLLLDGKGNLKVTDFGMSFMKAASQDANQVLLSTQCGTPKYMAPEVIMRPPEGYDGQKLDVWECGMVLYALLAGFLPFHGDDDNTVFRSILSGRVRFPSFFSPGAKDILRILLEKDPNKRASLEEVKQHPWFLVNYPGDRSAGYPDLPRRSGGASKASPPKPPKIPISPVSPRAQNSLALPSDSTISQKQKENDTDGQQEAKMTEPEKPQNENQDDKNSDNQGSTPTKPVSSPTESTKRPVDVQDIGRAAPRQNAATIDNQERAAEVRNPSWKNHQLPDSTSKRSSKDGNPIALPDDNSAKADPCIPDRSKQVLQAISNLSAMGNNDAIPPLTPISRWQENVRLDLFKLENESNDRQFVESPVNGTPASASSTRNTTFGAPSQNTGSPCGEDDTPRSFTPSSYRFPKSFKSFIAQRGGNPPDRESEASPSGSITGKSMKTLLRNIRSLGTSARVERDSATDEEEDEASWFTARSDVSPNTVMQGAESGPQKPPKFIKGGSEDVNKISAASRLNDIAQSPTTPSSASKSTWRMFQRPAIFR